MMWFFFLSALIFLWIHFYRMRSRKKAEKIYVCTVCDAYDCICEETEALDGKKRKDDP